MSPIRTELATAIRSINAAFNRLPVSVQESIRIGWDELDAELDDALVSDDRDRAMAAINAWRSHWLGVFEDRGLARSDPRTVAR